MAVGFALFLLVTLAIGSEEVQGYTYTGRTDTSKGYCELEGFGQIEIGESGYDDIRCEEAFCEENGYSVHGCGYVSYNPENCRRVDGTGHYPHCCVQIVCE